MGIESQSGRRRSRCGGPAGVLIGGAVLLFVWPGHVGGVTRDDYHAVERKGMAAVAAQEQAESSCSGKVFFNDGTVAMETDCSGGPEQVKKIYYRSGQLFQEVPVEGGRIVGAWKIYRPDGRLAHVRIFDASGRQVGEKYFDETGAEVRDGQWQGHDQDGNVTGPFRIKNGVREDGL